MKKTLLSLTLVVVMLLAVAIPAFAGEYDYTVAEPFYDTLSLNDRNVDSNENTLRSNFTPSRDVHLNSVVVMNGNDNYFKWVGPQWLTHDKDMTTSAMEHYLVTMKRGATLTGFAGYIYAWSKDAYDNQLTVTSSANDMGFIERNVANDTTAKYVLNTGFGYTFLKDSVSKVRFYVMYLGTAVDNVAPVNVMYTDFDAGVDLTAAFHEYHLYYDAYHGVALFFVDDKMAAKVTFSNEGTYTTTGSYIGADSKPVTFTMQKSYAKTAALYDKDGKLVAQTETSLISPASGNAELAIAGTGDELYISRLMKVNIVELPADPSATTAAPAAETTAAPATETTAAPAAETTAAPAAETTAAPAAETTAAPETTKAAEEKKGCGSVAAIGVAVVVSVLGCAIIRKKH